MQCHCGGRRSRPALITYVAYGAYAPSLLPGDIYGFEAAPVIPGVTTFPSIAGSQFAQPNVHIVNCNITLSGSTTTCNFPASEAGTVFGVRAFNGDMYYVYTPDNAPLGITRASLQSTNLPGLTSTDLSLSGNAIMLNFSGASLPASGAGSIKIKLPSPNRLRLRSLQQTANVLGGEDPVDFNYTAIAYFERHSGHVQSDHRSCKRRSNFGQPCKRRFRQQ